MKRATLLGLMGLLLGPTASLQAQAAMDDTEKAVEAQEQQWAKANNANNVTLEASLLAEGFIAIESDGTVLDRDKFLAQEKATKYTHVGIEGVIVHVHGATAVATYVFSAKGTGPDGKPIDVRLRLTDTWVKMPSGKLQCVATVDTALKS